jgi:hypothetical protein
MSPDAFIDKILPILSAVKNDKEKLERILAFLESQILPEIKEENNEITIPRKYEVVVHAIADAISAGLICHLNMDTLEIEDYFTGMDTDELEAEAGEKLEPKYLQWKNVLTFEPLESSESFRIMENFATEVENTKVQNILTDILSRRKPFAHFNSYIHNSKYREDRFKFRLTALEKHVRGMIYDKLDEKND